MRGRARSGCRERPCTKAQRRTAALTATAPRAYGDDRYWRGLGDFVLIQTNPASVKSHSDRSGTATPLPSLALSNPRKALVVTSLPLKSKACTSIMRRVCAKSDIAKRSKELGPWSWSSTSVRGRTRAAPVCGEVWKSDVPSLSSYRRARSRRR